MEWDGSASQPRLIDSYPTLQAPGIGSARPGFLRLARQSGWRVPFRMHTSIRPGEPTAERGRRIPPTRQLLGRRRSRSQRLRDEQARYIDFVEAIITIAELAGYLQYAALSHGGMRFLGAQ